MFSGPIPLGARLAGVAVAVLASAALLGGGTLLAVDHTERDDDGYFTTDAVALSADGHAIASDPLDDVEVHGDAERFVVDHVLGTVRVRATSTNGKPVLLGIARRAELERYLAGVASSRVTDVRDDGQVIAHDIAGGALSGAPAAQSFWTASSSGAGVQTLDWNVETGDWAVAVLNADGSAGVQAAIDVGTDTRVLRWLGFALLAAGLAALFSVAAVLMRARHASTLTNQTTDKEHS